MRCIESDDSPRVKDRSCFSGATNDVRTASRTPTGRSSNRIAPPKDRGSGSSPIWANWRREEQDGWAKLGSHLDGKAPPRCLQRSLFDPPQHDMPQDDEPLLVKLSSIRLERPRDFGDVWLAWGLWRMLGLDEFFDATDRARTRRRVLGHDGRDPDHRPLLRAVQRTAHCRHLVSANGPGRTARRHARADSHRPAVQGPRSAAAAQGGLGNASPRAAGRVVRVEMRPACCTT